MSQNQTKNDTNSHIETTLQDLKIHYTNYTVQTNTTNSLKNVTNMVSYPILQNSTHT